MKRAKLSQVVSAVFHLNKKAGVNMTAIADFLRHNYNLTVLPDYKKALKLAVNEGFLTVKQNRFYPSSCVVGPHDLLEARRKRRWMRRRGKRHDVVPDVLLTARRRRRGGSRRRRRGYTMDVELLSARRRRRGGGRRRRRYAVDHLVEARRRRRGGRRRRRHGVDAEELIAARRRRRSSRRRRHDNTDDLTQARRRRRRRGRKREGNDEVVAAQGEVQPGNEGAPNVDDNPQVQTKVE